jgi:pimeloyl-ACP methyl ester carboxylesterase
METRTFRLVHPEDPRRVIRGKIDVPAGAPASRAGWPHACLLHGFKGFMDWGFFPDMARRLAESGIAAVRFNASGSGVGEDLDRFGDLDAFEKNTLSRELEDVAAVRAWICSGGAAGIDRERNAWIGHSRGGGLALIHAAETGDPLGLVTWAAVSTFDRFDEEAKARCRRDGYLPILNSRTGQEMRLGAAALDDLERNRERFDVPAACGRVRAPVLLIHGSEDETVPAHESEILAAALGPATSSLLRVPGAGHTFGVRHPMEGTTDAWEHVAEATLAKVRECLI